ncbi:Competence protein A [Caulifigura coniformis]|uniref:Competence protein A n=1 Tax=Caulifigura coniformis TaxID=2527983 RepID=A0A517SAT0_9PLAN|nr:hypothetical protein [Caulifigura coniformis]QDT53223.1 Competence protein A [Caulifigura coniformis]
MASSSADQFKALWARLNADPNAQRARKTEPDWVVVQWEPTGVVIIEAHVGDRVSLKRVAEVSWGGASNPEDSTASAGSLLKDRLAALKISTRQAAVIVGRDAVVLRRLELPAVPDHELPDMVRFQAAAKASTPIDRMALDFVPLEAAPDAPRVAVTVTMDAARLRVIQETVAGAGLELAAIGLNATAVAELVSQAASPGSLKGVSLVLLQKGASLELTLLDEGRLAFAHSIRLEATEGAPALQPLQAELSRALMAMSQAHAGSEVSRVFVVPGVQLAPAVHDLLEKRFPGLVQRIDPRDSVQTTSLSGEEQTLALKAGAAIGQLLAAKRSTVPAIDFVNPRKRVEAPDTRKAKMRAYGGGLALLALLGIWMNMNAVSDREQRLADLTAEAATINQDVNSAAGKATRESAQVLKRWKESNPRPLETIEKLAALLPPTSDLILTDVYIKPGKPASAGAEATVSSNIKTLAWAKTQETVIELENRLASGGYNIATPSLPDQNLRDPDYPLLYTLVADQLIPRPAPPKPVPAAPK